MKKKILLIVLTFIFIPHVYADCDTSRVNELSNLAKNIEITYELDENKTEEELKAYEPDNIAEGVVKVIITGLTEKFYIHDEENNEIYNYYDAINGNIIINNVTRGSKKFYVYNAECNEKVKTLYIKIPTYNKYSLDPLCQDIPKNELSVCNTWYESNISYDEFKTKVENYYKSQEQKEQYKEQDTFDKVINWFKNNYIYLIISMLIMVSVVIFIKIRRKRSELE